MFDERVPPHSLEAEQAVLGACLLDPEALVKVRTVLLPEHFYHDKHGLIYSALLSVDKADTVTVSNYLRRIGKLERVDGISGLLVLTEAVPTTTNVEAYAEIVERTARQRAAIQAARQAIDELYRAQSEEDVENAGLALQWAVRDAPGQITDVVHLGEVAERRLSEERKRGRGSLRGHTTGFRSLDAITNGFVSGDMIVVAARPSVGKTALVLNMLRRSTRKTQKAGLIISKEMAAELLADRLIIAEARVDGMKYQQALLEVPDWHAAAEAVKRLKDTPLYCVDTHVTMSQIPRLARYLIREIGELGVIAIDYMQLMPPESKHRNRNRENEVAEISRATKRLAQEMGCPVVALSQLSRLVESRQNKRPALSDLRESGAIEQDADVVMLLYQPEEKPGITEIIVAKNRNGAIGTTELLWSPQHQRFDELEKQREPN